MYQFNNHKTEPSEPWVAGGSTLLPSPNLPPLKISLHFQNVSLRVVYAKPVQLKGTTPQIFRPSCGPEKGNRLPSVHEKIFSNTSCQRMNYFLSITVFTTTRN